MRVRWVMRVCPNPSCEKMGFWGSGRHHAFLHRWVKLTLTTLLTIIPAIPSLRGSAAGSDDPGFVSAHAPQIEYHPAVERLAGQLRAAPEHRGDRETIVDWLQIFFCGWQCHQPDGDAWEAYRLTIATLCGKLPLAVWSQDLLTRALLTFNTWPSVRELAAFLGAEDARQLAEIETLDCMAKADPHAGSGPASTSTELYNPRAPEWAFRHTVKHRASGDDNDSGVRIDPLADPAQLAALGVETPATDLCEARRHLFDPQREVKR